MQWYDVEICNRVYIDEITGPPCAICAFWKPIILSNGKDPAGIRCCHGPRMLPDFSCVRPHESENCSEVDTPITETSTVTNSCLCGCGALVSGPNMFSRGHHRRGVGAITKLEDVPITRLPYHGPSED